MLPPCHDLSSNTYIKLQSDIPKYNFRKPHNSAKLQDILYESVYISYLIDDFIHYLKFKNVIQHFTINTQLWLDYPRGNARGTD